MRKIIPLFALALLAFSLSACRLSGSTPSSNSAGEPTLSDAQAQTQISAVLTGQPSPTSAAVSPSDTPALPTVEKIIALASATPTQAPSPTATVPAASPTPTAPPTLAPTAGPTATKGPTPIAVPGDPVARLGSPSGTDPMDNSTHWNWPTGTNEFTSIDFSNGQMILASLKSITGWRLANPVSEPFGDLYLEATAKTGTCAGNDQYGLIARVPDLKEANKGILFGFTCDGQYSLRLWDGTAGSDGTMTVLVGWTANKAIHAGSNQTNRIGLMMTGSRLGLYANGVLLGTVNSSVYTSGYFGLFAGAIKTDGFNIQVDSMSYWTNPTP